MKEIDLGFLFGVVFATASAFAFETTITQPDKDKLRAQAATARTEGIIEGATQAAVKATLKQCGWKELFDEPGTR